MNMGRWLLNGAVVLGFPMMAGAALAQVTADAEAAAAWQGDATGGHGIAGLVWSCRAGEGLCV